VVFEPVMADEPMVLELVMADEVMVFEPVMADEVVVFEPVPRRKAGRARMATHASEAMHFMARRETGCAVTHLGKRGRR
jgi:hypothetical protein